MATKITRRELVVKSLIGFGALSTPLSLIGCDDDQKTDQPSTVPKFKAEFLHGVASGDPLQDRVIIWTRVTVADTSLKPTVTWQVSTDVEFKNIIATDKVVTTINQDFTVKVDVPKLSAGTAYFYRFICEQVTSPVGQTKTLPTKTDQVTFAVCSCSNYPAGYFHVYKEIAQTKPDVVIHLGDYIYEYGENGYATEDAKKLGRPFADNNNKEIISLDDYRRRYALYRTDIDLQLAHQVLPFIVVWDDHELSNDTWREGAENHQANEGDFYTRKLAALQAYFEWMPIRPIAENNYLNIYRQFDFGGLVNLIMLDTRIIARDQQLEYANYFTAQGQFDIPKFQTAIFDTKRTLLGYEQRQWLQNQLIQSKAVWNVFGQQVLMAKMLIPAELLMALSRMDIAKLNAQIPELMGLKMRHLQNDPTLTEQDKARIQTVVPYNLDAWDGYMAEREIIFQTLKQLNKKAVVLAGDTHNAWHSELYSQDGYLAAVELATSSVSSPGMEEYLKLPAAQVPQFEAIFATLIDELQYCNLNQRGYLQVKFTAQNVQADWKYINTIKDKTYMVDDARKHQVKYATNLVKTNL